MTTSAPFWRGKRGGHMDRPGRGVQGRALLGRLRQRGHGSPNSFFNLLLQGPSWVARSVESSPLHGASAVKQEPLDLSAFSTCEVRASTRQVTWYGGRTTDLCFTLAASISRSCAPLSIFSVCMLRLLEVKIRGQRIELGEIEAKLLQHQARRYCEQALATCRP